MVKKRGSTKDYLELSEYVKNYDHSKTKNEIKEYFDYLYDVNEMDELGLYLQICIKKSKPMYLHGYVLTSALYRYIKDNNINNLTILETGTARGFSSVCMGKILEKLNIDGCIYTIDILKHNEKKYWNCILDENSPQTRHELLEKWANIRDKYLNFQVGDSKNILNNLNLSRINFAFLDARHNYEYVKLELEYVSKKQQSGDIIVCDDYTKGQYEGIIKAIDEFLEKDLYDFKIFYGNDGTKNRGYVYMKKK